MKENIALKLKEVFDKDFVLENPKDRNLAHYAMPCFMMAKEYKKAPNIIAKEICEELNAKNLDCFESIENVGGYVNFKLSLEYLNSLANVALNKEEDYAKGSQKDKTFLLEYISANPTGPLHIGHARGAVYGDSLKRVARHLGYKFDTEYYVNDAGNQIALLGTSIALAIEDNILKSNPTYPESYYRGEYMDELAKYFYDKYKGDYKNNLEIISKEAKDIVLDEIKKTLKSCGIEIDSYVYETSYLDKLDQTLDKIKKAGGLYEKDGKVYIASSKYGDDSDRVVIKDDGKGTYLACDIVYHADKLGRGYSQNINIWGADHHGYIARVKASLKFLGFDDEKLEVILAQMVSLLKDGKPFKMSKRAGTSILMSDIIDEIGKDALRFMFLSKKCDSQFEFDLSDLKKEDSSNPVFYINYAYARINQVLAKSNYNKDDVLGIDFKNLSVEAKNILFESLILEDVLNDAFNSRSLNKICDYLKNLASNFHRLYNDEKIVGSDYEKEYLKLYLMIALSIKTAFNLIGVDAKKTM